MLRYFISSATILLLMAGTTFAEPLQIDGSKCTNGAVAVSVNGYWYCSNTSSATAALSEARTSLGTMARDAVNATLPAALNNLTSTATGHAFYANAYGSCTWTNAGDVGPCINAAITAAQALVANATGGGVVILPAGEYGLSTTIAQTNNKTGIMIVGAGGASSYGICGTKLKWLGTAGASMVEIGSDSFNNNVVGGGLEGICFDGNSLAGTGVKLRSANNGYYKDIGISNTTVVGWDIGVGTTINIGPSHNHFVKTTVGFNTAGSINAKGWKLSGSATANTHHNHWYLPHVQHQNGTGFECGNADSNVVIGYFSQAILSGTGLGLDLLGGASSLETCRSNAFLWAEPQGGTTARGTSSYTAASVNNKVDINGESGAPNPTLETGSTLFCMKNTGNNSYGTWWGTTGTFRTGATLSGMGGDNWFNVPAPMNSGRARLQVQSNNTDADLSLEPKGSGAVKFGYGNTDPIATLYRASNTNFHRNALSFNFNDSAGDEKSFATVSANLWSNTAGAYQGVLGFFTATAGALTERVRITHLGALEIGGGAFNKATNASVVLQNNIAYQSVDSGGTLRSLLRLNSSDATGLDGGAGGLILRDNYGASTIATSDGSGNLTFSNLVKLKNYTVATLPTCNAGNTYAIAAVSDATAPTYNGALTGGGAVKVPVMCDGTSWLSH